MARILCLTFVLQSSFKNRPLKSEVYSLPWRSSETDLSAWQKGMTGYPIVDAGMRELYQTGYMHNQTNDSWLFSC